MTKLLAIFVLVLTSVAMNAQSQATKRTQLLHQTYDEIVVSSDLSVRRNSKENRQGKQLTNVPSGTTDPPGKSTAAGASRLVLLSDDKTPPERRKKRSTQSSPSSSSLSSSSLTSPTSSSSSSSSNIESNNARLSEKGIKEYLLRSNRSFDNKIST